MIEFTVHGDPIAKGRPVFGGGRARTPEKTREAALRFTRSAAVALRGSEHLLPLAGPLGLDVVFCMPMPAKPKAHQTEGSWHTSRPDADNLLKLVCDCLNELVWNDDAQVAFVTVRKVYSKEPRTIVKAFHVPVDGALSHTETR
jgi:Holliday junction resolvase RusA-like endonuclease